MNGYSEGLFLLVNAEFFLRMRIPMIYLFNLLPARLHLPQDFRRQIVRNR